MILKNIVSIATNAKLNVKLLLSKIVLLKAVAAVFPAPVS